MLPATPESAVLNQQSWLTTAYRLGNAYGELRFASSLLKALGKNYHW